MFLQQAAGNKALKVTIHNIYIVKSSAMCRHNTEQRSIWLMVSLRFHLSKLTIMCVVAIFSKVHIG